jgi:hypothetical protein
MEIKNILFVIWNILLNMVLTVQKLMLVYIMIVACDTIKKCINFELLFYLKIME